MTDGLSLRITDKTTLAELSDFADKAGDGAKIRGKEHSDGSVTLYASTKKGTGLLNVFSDHRAKSRDAAHKGIAKVLDAVKKQDALWAMSHIKSTLPSGKADIKGADLKSALTDARRVRDESAKDVRSTRQIAVALEKSAGQAAAGNLNPDVADSLAVELGNKLAEHYKGQPRSVQQDLMMSRGDAFKDDLLQDLADSLDDPGLLDTSYADADPALKAMLDKAYDHLATHLSDRVAEDGTLTIDGVDYQKVEQLGVGGFGTVDLYRSGAGEEIVVKTPIFEDTGDEDAQKAKKFDEAAREAKAHRSAQQGNNGHVAELKGVVRTPDGKLLLAMEHASKGDFNDISKKLADKVEAGDITQEEANRARLTLLQDMTKGLAHVQKTRGMTHLDVKGPNFFVDGNGVAKLGDFGTAIAGTRNTLHQRPVDNPLWLAPEVIAGEKAMNRTVEEFRNKLNDELDAARTQLATMLPDDERGDVLANIRQNKAAQIDDFESRQGFDVTAKADTWSLGIEMYRTFFDQTPFDHKFMYKAQQNLVDFQSDKSNRVHVPDDKDAGLDPQQLVQLDDLLGQMLHPDPTERPDLDDVLQHPLFDMPGVGSQAARDIIKNL